jgi:hypothetical protein
MTIDDRFALHRASDDGRLSESATRIERNDPWLRWLTPPGVEAQREPVSVEFDALEAALDHLADRGLAAMRGVDELPHLLDEDTASIRTERRRQKWTLAADKSQRTPHAL